MNDMNKRDYIAKVNRELRHVDRKTKKMIVTDIQSHLEDFDDTAESVVEHFGTAQELVAQYLSDMNAKSSIIFIIQSLMRRTIFVAGVVIIIVLIALFALGWGLWKFIDRDSFDLSDETARQLNTDGWDWNNYPYGEEKITLEVRQGDLVLYWHDKQEILWHCKGDEDNNSLVTDEVYLTFSLRHNRCWIFLPYRPVEIRTIQAKLTLVRPQGNALINAIQSHVRIAEKGQSYNYHLDLQGSNFTPLISHPDEAVAITITALQSEVEPYVYR